MNESIDSGVGELRAYERDHQESGVERGCQAGGECKACKDWFVTVPFKYASCAWAWVPGMSICQKSLRTHCRRKVCLSIGV